MMENVRKDNRVKKTVWIWRLRTAPHPCFYSSITDLLNHLGTLIQEMDFTAATDQAVGEKSRSPAQVEDDFIRRTGKEICHPVHATGHESTDPPVIVGCNPIKRFSHPTPSLVPLPRHASPARDLPACYDIAMSCPGHPAHLGKNGVEGFLDQFRSIGRTVIPTDSGRSALVMVLRTLATREFSGIAWLPAYACPSLPLAFRKAGIRIRRYGTASSFRPVFPSAGPERGDVVLLIHYFGFPNRGALGWIRSRSPENRPFVIEDCAGSSLSGNIGITGDFALFSFRKFFEIPDGGAMISRFSVDSSLNPADPILAIKRNEAFNSFRKGNPGIGLRLLERAEAHLDGAFSLLPRAPARESWETLKRIPFREEACRRRAFAKQLTKQICDDPGLSTMLSPLFPSVCDEAAPLFLPVEVRGDREKLSRLLNRAGFDCPSLWDLNPALRYSFPAEFRLGKRTVGLPIPRINCESDFKVIVESLKAFPS